MTEELPTVRISIIVASQSGTAALVGDILSERIGAIERYQVRRLPEDNIPHIAFHDVDVLLPIVATHGDGELPDAFMPTYEAMKTTRPDLSHLRYGLIALGDRTYHQTFCGAGQLVDAMLAELGARRVGERCEIDASCQPFPDEDALAWMEDWLPLL